MDIYEEIVRLRKLGQKCALATIVEVRGSIPSYGSAKMLVREDGSIAGTIGGGCVEADKVYQAAFVTAQGVPLKYGSNRQDHPEHIVEVMRDYLKHHLPLRVDLRGTFTLI